MSKRVTSHLLTKDIDSLILGRGNDIGQHINKNAINRLQSVPWSINEEILPFLHDTLKPSEETLTVFETTERLKAYKLRDKETDNTIDYLLENGNQFYFGWKFDKRGRQYSQGYHINPQGNEYRKAMLSFANKKLLTVEGMGYLKIDIANCMGYDKLTWFARKMKAGAIIADVFKDGRSTDRKIREYSEQADTPLLFIKAMYAWKEGVINGNPIGHNMGLDSTASGLQYLSALSGCCVTARHANVHALIERTYTEEAQNRLEELEAELKLLD